MRDRGALVALGLILVAILLLATLTGWRASSLPVGPPAEFQEGRGPIEGHWWPEFSARDSYAQWAMTILAAGALAVSFIGLRWIRQTLEATRSANTIALESNERQLRAYMAIDKTEVLKFEPGSPFELKIYIVNTGQTPARRVRVAFRTKSDLDPEKVRYSFAGIPKSSADVGPQRFITQTLKGNAPLTSAEHLALSTGPTRLAVGGLVRYRDIFKRRRFVTFRGYLQVRNDGSVAISVCERNNRSN